MTQKEIALNVSKLSFSVCAFFEKKRFDIITLDLNMFSFLKIPMIKKLASIKTSTTNAIGKIYSIFLPRKAKLSIKRAFNLPIT